MTGSDSVNILKGKYKRALYTINTLEKEKDNIQKAFDYYKESIVRTHKITEELCVSIMKRRQAKDVEQAWWKKSLDDKILEARENVDGYFDSLKPELELMKNNIDTLKQMNNTKTQIIEKIQEDKERLQKEMAEMEERKNKVIETLSKKLRTGKMEEEDINKIISSGSKKYEDINKPIAQKMELHTELSDGIEAEVYEATGMFYEAKELGIPVKMGPKLETHEELKAVQQQKVRELAEEKSRIIASYARSLKDHHKLVIRAFGETGFSETNDIVAHILEQPDHPSNSRVRTSSHELTKPMNEMPEPVLNIIKFSISCSPNFAVYKLSDMGSDIYRYLFEKEPAESEVDIIKKDHTSLEHGYGIKKLALFLKNTGYVKNRSADVIYLTRATEYKIKIDDRTSYIPDIVIHFYDRKNNRDIKQYIEYETGKCTETDLISKCNKMVTFTRTLNFVVPNKEAKDILIKKFEKWRDSITKDEITFPGDKTIYFKINTMDDLKNNDCSKVIPWEWERKIMKPVRKDG